MTKFTARAIWGAGSPPPLDDLGVLERSDELDAEPGAGDGTVRPVCSSVHGPAHAARRETISSFT